MNWAEESEKPPSFLTKTENQRLNWRKPANRMRTRHQNRKPAIIKSENRKTEPKNWPNPQNRKPQCPPHGGYFNIETSHEGLFRTTNPSSVTGYFTITTPGGGGGGYLTKFNTGRLRPEVQPLTLSYTILAEKVTLLSVYIPFTEKRYPFHIPTLESLVLVFM